MPLSPIRNDRRALGLGRRGNVGLAGRYVARGACAARGLRVPSRNALLADTVSTSAYGRAYGFERMMDNLGAVGGPPQSPPVASLLPLAVRAGALAFAGLVAGSRERTRRRCTRTTRARVGPPRPALPTAMRHDTGLAQPWASRRVERGRGDAQGGEPRGALAGHRTGGSYLRLATDGGPFCVCWGTSTRPVCASAHE